MAAIMVVICIVVVSAGNNGFMRPHDAGASAMQTPHTQTEVQRTQEEDS